MSQCFQFYFEFVHFRSPISTFDEYASNSPISPNIYSNKKATREVIELNFGLNSVNLILKSCHIDFVISFVILFDFQDVSYRTMASTTLAFFFPFSGFSDAF